MVQRRELHQQPVCSGLLGRLGGDSHYHRHLLGPFRRLLDERLLQVSTLVALSGIFFQLLCCSDNYTRIDTGSCGAQYINEAANILQDSNYWTTDDGTDNWIVNGVRISQTADGLVR